MNTGSLIVVGGGIGAGVLLLVTLFTVLSRFYRRCGADEALVRTGMGGNKVVIGGGILVYPILHQLLRVSLRSVKLSVERSGKNALVTSDKIKANVTTELYIKVQPIADDVLAAARSFGDRNLDDHAIGVLIEGKLTDALRSVAANQAFMSLHGKRKEFAEHIQAALSEELRKNGLTLENVSITSLSMVSVRDLDEHDVFDAEGLRAITESVQTNREHTNKIQREKENQIHAQNVAARARQLQLEEQQKQAEADQARRVSEYQALQTAEMAKAVYVQERSQELAAYEKQAAVETARILQEQAIAVANAEKQRAEREAQIAAEKGQQAAEIAKQRTIEAAQIEKEKVVQAAEVERQKAIEVAHIGKVIAVTQSEEAQARAAAAKALAMAEEEAAKQQIVTVEATAKANCAKQIAVIQAEAEAEVKRALAEGETAKARALAEAALEQARGRALAAEKEAEAMVTLAAAAAQRGEAEAQARRKLVDAENATSTRLLMRDVALEVIRHMPEVTRELMAPAKQIREIKVLQTGGVGSAAGGGASAEQPMGAITPILKAILEAGAAYPLVREMLKFAQVDGDAVAGHARGLLGEVKKEIALASQEDAPAAEATPASGPPSIRVTKANGHATGSDAAGE
jgi:uncharacterized membrane protein YqiK